MVRGLGACCPYWGPYAGPRPVGSGGASPTPTGGIGPALVCEGRLRAGVVPSSGMRRSSSVIYSLPPGILSQ